MISGGFGTVYDLETGTSRQWFMRADGIKRWADTGEQCETDVRPEDDPNEFADEWK